MIRKDTNLYRNLVYLQSLSSFKLKGNSQFHTFLSWVLSLHATRQAQDAKQRSWLSYAGRVRTASACNPSYKCRSCRAACGYRFLDLLPTRNLEYRIRNGLLTIRPQGLGCLTGNIRDSTGNRIQPSPAKVIGEKASACDGKRDEKNHQTGLMTYHIL